MPPLVSIVITTRNRRDDLAICLESCFAQTYRPLEILVFDGASTDGTETAVRDRFPEARFFGDDQDRGFVALRNRGYREAGGTYVVSLDDDAYYTDRRTIEALVQDFESHPEAAAVAMPFLVSEPAPTPGGTIPGAHGERPLYLRAFTGCAHALRREVALALGPYREIPSYLREDRDLSIRLLGQGASIILGTTPPVVHLKSPSRDWGQRLELDVRSTLLFDYLNIPHPYVAPRMILDAVQLALYKITPSQVLRRLGYIFRGLLACVKCARQRRPVSREVYRRYRMLPGHGPVPWSDEVPKPARRQG